MSTAVILMIPGRKMTACICNYLNTHFYDSRFCLPFALYLVYKSCIYEDISTMKQFYNLIYKTFPSSEAAALSKINGLPGQGMRHNKCFCLRFCQGLQGKSKSRSEAGAAVDAPGTARVQPDTACLGLTNMKEKQRGTGKIVFVPREVKKTNCLAQLVLELRVIACVLKKHVHSHMLFVLLRHTGWLHLEVSTQCTLNVVLSTR